MQVPMFDYSTPNPYNRWDDWSPTFDQLINPYFPKSAPMAYPFFYELHINTKNLYSFRRGMPWTYNSPETFVRDIQHTLACTLFHSGKLSEQEINLIFARKPLQLPVLRREELGSEGRNIWNYDQDGISIAVVAV